MKSRKSQWALLNISILSVLAVYLLMPLSDDTWNLGSSNKLDTKHNLLDATHSNLDSDSLPNIVLIVADDLAFSDLSINGNPFIKTDHLDQIAKEGVNYINAYCTAPICATSRAAILTGRYQNRFGFEYQMQNRYAKNRMEILGMNWFVKSYPWSLKWTTSVPSDEMMQRQGLPINEITIAEVLKKVGYQTGIIGKWHLGKTEPKLPQNFGFDYHYGFYNSHSLYVPESSEGYIDLKVKEDWTDQYIWKSQRDGLSAIVENGVEIKESKYLTDQIASKTIEFIKSCGNEPFFAYVQFSAPHTPFQAPEDIYEDLDHIGDPVVRIYQSMIKSLDLAIGDIYNHLKINGLLENTMIIITSDNGGASYTTATENGPFKGGKINQFEGGLRVPFLVRMPGLGSDSTSTKRISTLDISKTIFENCGIDNPLLNLDGLDLLDIEVSHNDRDLFWQVGNSKTVISKNLKLIYNDGDEPFVRLYDLIKDPFENNDISMLSPEKVHELKLKHNQWSQNMQKPLWPGVVNFAVKDKGQTLLFES